MQWSDLPLRPTPTMLRQFGLIGLAVFGALAAWKGVKGQSHEATVLAMAAVVFGLTGTLRPTLLRLVFVAWMVAAWPIGWLVSRGVLAAVYFGVITPLALFFRAIGRDALRRRPAQVDSYWVTKSTPTDPRRYFRQY